MQNNIENVSKTTFRAYKEFDITTYNQPLQPKNLPA